jgi:hypothetical protein
MKKIHWTDQCDSLTLWTVFVSFQKHQSTPHQVLSEMKNHHCRGLCAMATPKGNNKLVLTALSLAAKSASVATAKAIPDASKRSRLAGDKS